MFLLLANGIDRLSHDVNQNVLVATSNIIQQILLVLKS